LKSLLLETKGEALLNGTKILLSALGLLFLRKLVETQKVQEIFSYLWQSKRYLLIHASSLRMRLNWSSIVKTSLAGNPLYLGMQADGTTP